MKRRGRLRKFISRRPDSKKSGSPHSPKSRAGWCTKPRSARGYSHPPGTLQKPRGLDFQVAHVTRHSEHVCIQAGPVGPPRSHSSLRGSAPQSGPRYLDWDLVIWIGTPRPQRAAHLLPSQTTTVHALRCHSFLCPGSGFWRSREVFKNKLYISWALCFHSILSSKQFKDTRFCIR